MYQWFTQGSGSGNRAKATDKQEKEKEKEKEKENEKEKEKENEEENAEFALRQLATMTFSGDDPSAEQFSLATFQPAIENVLAQKLKGTQEQFMLAKQVLNSVQAAQEKIKITNQLIQTGQISQEQGQKEIATTIAELTQYAKSLEKKSQAINENPWGEVVFALQEFAKSTQTSKSELIQAILRLENVLDVDKSNNNNLLHFLADKWNQLTLDEKILEALVQKLKARGVKLNQKNNLNQSPLDIACENNQLAIVRILLKNGAKMDEGWNPSGKGMSESEYLIRLCDMHDHLREMLFWAAKGSYFTKRCLTLFKEKFVIDDYISLHLAGYRVGVGVSEGHDFLISDLRSPKLSSREKSYLVNLIISSTELEYTFCLRLAELAVEKKDLTLPDETINQILKLLVEKAKESKINSESKVAAAELMQKNFQEQQQSTITKTA
jgi:hypothetical protein